MTSQSSRWFQLSGREIRVLLVAGGLVVLFLSYLEIRYRVGAGDQFRIKNAVEKIEQPVRMDINTARGYELQLLPGIGPKTAQGVIQDRKENGPYGDLEDLDRVDGIGPKTVEKLRPYVMCRPPRKQF